jgi:hypothetical protein
MEIRSDSLDFSSPLRGDGPRQASKTMVFPRAVTSAVAGLSGYLAEFSSQDDHHVGRLDLRLDTTINNNTVTVDGHFGVRDWSGNWDDAYDGLLDVVVLAELESATQPPPRGDLAITGMEFNQAAQFFRAATYLDPVNAHPDNSIFLIQGKNTGVRVFVDWDSSAGLPPISNLGGELLISNGTATVTLAPINPGGSIVPKRDSVINQALANDTLNFMIPGAFSAGTVTVTCHVFDQASTSARSAAFTRTLVFTPVEPLNLFLVGITTQRPAAPAPTQAAIAAALILLKQTYPRGTVQATGFNTATLASQIVGSTATSGCGQGWSDLLDILRELKGDSDDIYFGGLPAGIFASGVVGCSPVGDRVAASFIDLPVTVPHEVGHSLGRQHAPCRGCSPPAQDPDNTFPQYNTFNSDSIGVFGFDPTSNTVFNPASSLDFMTAFVPASPWISPYTHQALLGTVQGGPSPGGAMSVLKGLRMTLFLRMEISRQREVHRDVSFCYPAPAQGSGCPTGFSYELLDAEHRVLDCGPLRCPCPESECECWPRRIRTAIPWPPDTRWLRVLEGDEEIYAERVLEAPNVEIDAHQADKDGVHIKWKAVHAEEGDGQGAEDIQYLVQVQDSGGETFRGLHERSSRTTAVIPQRLFTKSPSLTVRVLACSGLATAVAQTKVTLDEFVPPEITMQLLDVDDVGDEAAELPAVASVFAADTAGREVSPENIAWYDANGNLLARGREVDLRGLPRGSGLIRAVARSQSGRTMAKSWLVERAIGGFRLLAVVPDPQRAARAVPHVHPHPRPDGPANNQGA